MPQARFQSLVERHRSAVTKLTTRLAKGSIDAEQWGDGMDALLFRGHADAITLGRQMAGDRTAQTDDDQLLAIDIKDREAEWLNRFIDDISTGRYTLEDGSLNTAAIERRAGMYVEKMRSSANEAFVEASDVDELWNWVMGGIEHCEDCPRFASLSPFTRFELYTYPGGGDTECLTNCNCYLVRVSDGKVGLTRSF